MELDLSFSLQFLIKKTALGSRDNIENPFHPRPILKHAKENN